MQVGQRHLAALATQIAELKQSITEDLHNSIGVLNQPGSMQRSTEEVLNLAAELTTTLSALHVAQAWQAELMLARLNGSTLADVRDIMIRRLVESATISDADERLTLMEAHLHREMLDAFSQSVCDLEQMIAAESELENCVQAFGLNIDAVVNTLDDPDADAGNMPRSVLAQGVAGAA